MEAMATRTDAGGFYRFVGLAPARYSSLVDAGQFGATHEVGSLGTGSDRDRPIVLKEGEVREVNAVLARAHAISVRIVDAWGDPLSDVAVTIQSADTGTQVGRMGSRTTDDRGVLRLFGLRPGRYILCAEGDRLGTPASQGSGRRREALQRTCYPSATDEAQAQPVRLERSDIGELEISMRSGRTFNISGRVLDASGAPAAGALFGLAEYQASGSSSRRIGLGADGQFAIANVHPGDYAIEAFLGGPDRPDQRRPLEAAFLPVRVEASDVEGLAVAMKKGVDVAGRITLEDPTARGPLGPGSGLTVHARLADDRLPGLGSTRMAFVGEDQLFVLTGLFGRRTLGFRNVPPRWYVKSIRYRGREIIDEPTELAAGTDPARLEVILSNRGAVVTGRAVDDRGVPVGRARLVMFRRDSIDAGVTDTGASPAGAFRIGPVRGGDYLIVALPASAPLVDSGQRARLARLATLAERLTLDDLDERVVDLRVVTER